MVDRAVSICDKEYFPQETEYIKNTLHENGYPINFVSSIIRDSLNQTRSNQATRESTQPLKITIPYVQGLGESIKELGLGLNFKVFFKSSPNLRSILRSDKSKAPKEEVPGVVYQIKCCCAASYIGETGNSLLHRFGEHMATVERYKTARIREEGGQPKRERPQRLDPKKAIEDTIKASVIIEHYSQCSNDLQPYILCRESLFSLRKIKEALFIKTNRRFNYDKGAEVSDVWSTVITKAACCNLHI
uniref:GIY-YIG domain-containing protein n=1 Tax=Trichuris muris TaxID=70415 RepID=A0A5S6R3X9_TRIMR